MYYSCKLLFFPFLFYSWAAVCTCFYARLSSLHYQALSAFLCFSDKLNDNNYDNQKHAKILTIINKGNYEFLTY